MTYWKTPTTIMESSHVIEMRAMVQNPITLRRMSFGQSMDLEVDCLIS
jgi:hypothetical protein